MNSIACAMGAIFVIQDDGHCLSFFNRKNSRVPHYFRPDLSVDERIAHVACGSKHGMVFSTKGRLWGLNLNELSGQMSYFAIDVQNLMEDGGIADLACSKRHTALITNNGHLWMTSDNVHNDWGETTCGRNFVQVPLQGLIEGESIAQVSCSHSHTVLLTNKGHLWGMGKNDYGQLGLGDANLRLQFIKIDLPSSIEDESIARVACGSNSTVLLTTKGCLWVAGNNEGGQLGLTNQADHRSINIFTHSPIPTLMEGESVTKVACRHSYTLFLTTKGRLWRTSGQVRNTEAGELSGYILSPPVLMKDEGIADFAYCAGVSDNCALLTTRGRLFLEKQTRQLSLTREFVSAGYLIRSPLFGKIERFTASSNCLSDEYAELIKTVFQYPRWFRQHVNKKETTSSLLSISAVIRKEWSRLTLGTMPEETKISYLQLFCWLRLSMLDPALANSLRTNLRLNSKDYLVAEGSLPQEGVLISRYSNSAHEPVSIYHLPILLEGQEAIVLSMSPIIIITAEEERYDTRCIPAPPLQLLDLPEDVLAMILNYLQPVSVVKLMNTCKTAQPAIDRHLIKPLALSPIPNEYTQARATIETPYSLQTIKHIDALLQDIFNKTGDERIFCLKKLLLAGQVSCFCLLDLHQRVCTSDETNPSLPSPNIAGFSFAPSKRKKRIGWF